MRASLKRIEFIAGTRWQTELEELKRQSVRRPTDHIIDLAALGDVIDVIVDDRNVSAEIEREQIFTFTANLLDALIELRAAPSSKAFVQTELSPWEFVISLTPTGTLSLSLYSLSTPTEVAFFEQELDASSFIASVTALARSLAEPLQQLAPELSKVGLGARLVSSLEALSSTRALGARPQLTDLPSVIGEHALGPTSTLRWRIQADQLCLAPPSPPRRMDLHALLFSGALELSNNDEIVFARTRPMLGLMTLLDRCDRGELAPGRLSWLELNRGLIQLLDDLPDHLQANVRVIALRERLTAHTHQHTAPTPKPTSDALEISSARQDAPARFPFELDRVRAMHPRVRWTWSHEDIWLKDAVHDNGQLFIPWRDGVIALDAVNGIEHWREPGPFIRRSALGVTTSCFLAQRSPTELEIRDRHTGDLIATAPLPRMHRCLRFDALSDDAVLALGERGAMAAFDLTDASCRWHQPGGLRGPGIYARDGQTLIRLQGGELARFDAATGDRLWSEKTRDFARDVCIHKGRVIVAGAGAHRAHTQICAYDMTTGQLANELSLDGYYLGPMRSIEDELWIIIDRNRRPVVEALRGPELLPVWLYPLQAQPRDFAPSITPAPSSTHPGRALVQTSASQRVMLRAEDGAVLWNAHGAATARGPQPAQFVRGGCLCLGESLELRLTESGELLHEFDEFIDDPCLMIASGQLEVLLGEMPLDDEPPTLIKLGFDHYLAIAYDRHTDT